MTDRPIPYPAQPGVLARLRILLERADAAIHHDPMDAMAADLAMTKQRLARVEARLEAMTHR